MPSDFLVLAGALLPEGAPAPRGVRDAPFGAVAIDTDDVGASAARVAAQFAAEVGCVGVCVPHVHIDAVRAALGDFVDATDGSPLGAGINLIDLHVAKGLEFDAVVVVEPEAILRERPDGGVGGLYTALDAVDAGARDRAFRSRFPRRFRTRPCCGQKLTAISVRVLSWTSSSS